MTPIPPTEIYKEQYAHMRAMNNILYKIPPIFTTIIGGLWVFAINFSGHDHLVPFVIFLFSAITSLCFTNIVHRFGRAFSNYIDNLNKMDGEYQVNIKQSGKTPSTIHTIQFLLGLASVVSLGGALYTLFH